MGHWSDDPRKRWSSYGVDRKVPFRLNKSEYWHTIYLTAIVAIESLKLWGRISCCQLDDPQCLRSLKSNGQGARLTDKLCTV